MAVELFFSPTLSGALYSEALEGGGHGISFGNVVNGDYAPMTDKISNTGHKNVYLYHNAVAEPVTNVQLFLQIYGTTSGFAYGGQRTAGGDYTDILALGSASGSSKNNLDGASGGLWVDMDWDAVALNQFDRANFPARVKIFGKSGEGVDIASGITVSAEAMVWNNAGETSATAPIAGRIGKAGDAVLGDNAHLKLRIYLPSTWDEGGNYQAELACSYRYTA